ncbi:TPA_asm: VP4-like membrane fusion protein [Geoglobus acetivorans pleomorphic virus 1]|uniref:Envelope protein N-terminal domain-containing protein n=2 Tax=root TaxID=1 RepID=A0A0A7GEF2_GEOAI|nr:hypothetical protein GACE_1426 [Geoglobus acetivorans]
MSDKRKAVMAALMLMMLIGQTVAIPLIIPIAVGFAASSVFGYWLGIQDSENYQELIQQYEAQLTSNTVQNDINTRLYLQEIYARDNNIISLGQDLLKYSENYAWALAKYNALKVIDYELTQNGSDFLTAKTKAKQAAHDVVYNYYLNLTRNIITLANESAGLLNYSLNYYLSNVRVSTVEMFVTGSQADGSIIITYSKITYNPNTGSYAVTYSGTTDKQVYANSIILSTATVSALGNSYTYNVVKAQVQNTNSYDPDPYAWVTINKVLIGGDLVYDRSNYTVILSQIDSEYNMINANIDAYIDGLAQDYVANWNVTQLIDPYILAGLLNNDLNQTGYYGYAAAELALLGLNTTGINKTITITVYDGNNTTTLEGWLFTDWTGTLEVGKNYTTDSSYKWFFVADDGIYDLTGYNFTVGTIRDWQDNELTNVTLTRYISHTGDVLKMYDELAQIRQLYEEYINNLQAMAAGGSGGGFSLSEWWASLDQAAKIGVIAIGAVGVYAILGRRR